MAEHHRTPDAATPPVVRLSNVRKYFTRRDGTRVPAIDGISLDVAPGQFFVLLGPSGCGKTTLLRCIAGLEYPDEGSIELSGRQHFSAKTGLSTGPEQRGLGMVFQSYALWPHMKVFDNVAFPLRTRKISEREVRERVNDILAAVGIAELAHQYPGQLSGGQQQRVALARALVSNRELVLFDEPLSNVDAKVREQLRSEILRMRDEVGFAAVYVTHDQQEAMELADQIAVLDKGKVAQIGPPKQIYESPENQQVARFVGQVNEIFGVVENFSEQDGHVLAEVRTSAGSMFARVGNGRMSAGDRVVVVIRPERCVLKSSMDGTPLNTWPVRLLASTFMGAKTEYVVSTHELGEMRIHLDNDLSLPEGRAVLHLPPQHSRTLPA